MKPFVQVLVVFLILNGAIGCGVKGDLQPYVEVHPEKPPQKDVKK